MAIRTVLTRGYGNGTFSGTIPLVLTRGYAIGAAVVLTDEGILVTLPPRGFTAEVSRRSLSMTLPPRDFSLEMKGGTRVGV